MKPTSKLEALLAGAWERRADLETLEALALEALSTRQSLGLALSVLGHAALARNDLRVARMLFRRALAADSALLDARRGAHIVERRLRRGRSPFAALLAALSATFALR